MAINPQALEEYREILGDEFASFFDDLVETFFQTAPQLFQEMNEAVKKEDAKRFTRAAHTLKSNSKTFGADDFAKLAFELEKLGSAGDLNGAGEKLSALEEDFQQVVAELEELRASIKP